MQSAGRGQGVGAAGADGRHAVGRLDHVAGAADQQQVVAIDGNQHRLQAAQVAVHAPVLGQLGGGPGHAALEVLELGLEALQQGEGVGGGAGEADSTLPSCSRRILWASLFMTTLPSVTWPSPPMATPPRAARPG